MYIIYIIMLYLIYYLHYVYYYLYYVQYYIYYYIHYTMYIIVILIITGHLIYIARNNTWSISSAHDKHLFSGFKSIHLCQQLIHNTSTGCRLNEQRYVCFRSPQISLAKDTIKIVRNRLVESLPRNFKFRYMSRQIWL